MEDSKDKKKPVRRRHYRGRNTDRKKENDKIESGEKPVKQDRDDKSGKREKKEKNRRQDEKKRPVRRDAKDEIPAEDKAFRVRREPEEPVFEFAWADAWGLYGTGYHVVVKNSQDKLYLTYGELKMGQRLQDFLDDMKACGIGSWDGRRYTKQGIFDGDTWTIKANSLTLKCEAQGTNEYPDEWKSFLNCLHEKWNIPVSKREQWE